MAYATVHRGDFVKIAVYAISKNEEKFVERWVKSMDEADEIYVADTGSTDNTVELLKQKGIIVNSINIEPWRFDDARNKSLEFVRDFLLSIIQEVANIDFLISFYRDNALGQHCLM